MLRRKIEHLLKKLKYEKLGYSRNELAEQKVFFFYFKLSLFLLFLKIWTPVFTFYFCLINLWRNNEYRAMRKKLQKQPFANILQNRCSWEIPALKSLFNKVPDLKTCKFIQKRLQHRCHEEETTEAIVRRYSSKKAFLKILQGSQENTYVRVSF